MPEGIASAPLSAPERGRAGASAEREHQRRKRNREAHTRRLHPHAGRLLLAVKPPPQHETAFLRGGLGEESVARSLQRKTANGQAIILHDRRMPLGRGNIDHLAVAPAGVFVIDTKDINGKVRVARPRSDRAKLLVNGRNRSKLVHGLDRQVEAVRQALLDLGHDDVMVHSAFCFTKADLPFFGSTQIGGHNLHHRRALARKLNGSGPLTPQAIRTLARKLASAFPPA